MCTPSDGAGPSNAVGALVNNLLGGASKTQQQLRELPTVQPGLHGPPPGLLTPETAAAAMAAHADQLYIPGMAPSTMDAAAASALMGGMMHHGPAEDWDKIFSGQAGPTGITAHPPGPMPPGPMPGMAPHAALTRHFQAFFSSARNTIHPAAAGPLAPGLAATLSVVDKCRIRDRSTIMARHIFADMGEHYADQQVNHLLHSLHINPQELPAELPHVHDHAWHDIWSQGHPGGAGPLMAADVAAGAQQWDAIWAGQQGRALAGMPPHARTLSTGWAAEFDATQAAAPPPSTSPWAEEFAAAHPGEAWASEFTSATDTSAQARSAAATSSDAMQSTRALVDILSRDADPKMRNSKFLQFVSKMSKGELLFEDNKVVERNPQAASWASEFAAQDVRPAQSWANEFSATTAAPSTTHGDWADEFAKGVADLNLDGEAGGLEKAWEEAANTWVQEFNAGDEETFQEWERIYGHSNFSSVLGGGVKGEYVFARDNPFMGDPEAFSKGKDLFRRGVLTEACLALEAEVQANPKNAEAWRLLGTVHAENDDDQQAIAAMSKALDADPSSADVLLSLGVSHTNELDQGEALSYLTRWLDGHRSYHAIFASAGPPPDSSQRLPHVVRMFNQAVQQNPEDAELHMALGVLHHLGRQYGSAISAFERALKLRPQDYSLWNKLGATLANNARSSEAIFAYQKALDLKPNYMRAWTNMGISFANVGDYDKSARFYVRALGLNPSASHVWGYLRTALACAGKMDLMPAVDSQDLAALSAQLPLV
eukprot:CAMPEP_0202890112 /NCGR_PEP_ID=MMETSP1392-20130828/620_1 /ASSEMBLY_ACC=CAM_ASM_000868 /TAXON_ID=225041 /ORGANISM="Chlamydomonas chlamydogama, Strain SAG 11-48b" /LENGTH=769 /DNA_ID=CAMNT_0049573613 /DNA_START=142 /DNA_END=2451 /DNA_ORIENTATION=-